jgi:hypothetical protein
MLDNKTPSSRNTRRVKYTKALHGVCPCNCHRSDGGGDCGCCYDLAELIARTVNQEQAELIDFLRRRADEWDGQVLPLKHLYRWLDEWLEATEDAVSKANRLARDELRQALEKDQGYSYFDKEEE